MSVRSRRWRRLPAGRYADVRGAWLRDEFPAGRRVAGPRLPLPGLAQPPRRHGGDLYDIVGKVRAIDVQRGEATPGAGCETSITAARDLEALVAMMAGGADRPPQAHPVAELRYWITFWLADGTTLGRPYFAETR